MREDRRAIPAGVRAAGSAGEFNKAENYKVAEDAAEMREFEGMAEENALAADAADWIALALARNLDTLAAVRLLRAFGSPAETLGASLTDLARVAGMPAAEGVRAAARGLEEADDALEWLRGTPGARLITLADPDFPARLVGTGRAPLALFARGDASLLSDELVAVVGAEAPTEEGARDAFEFARAISEAGASVLAVVEEGVASAALSGALSSRGGRPPTALLATGLAKAPRGRAELQRAVLDAGGLLLSAEAPGSGQDEASRRRRDGILAALPGRLLLVEASRRDPAVAVARDAAGCGTAVGAIPGSIHAPLARGSNLLIREGAALVETVGDLLA